MHPSLRSTGARHRPRRAGRRRVRGRSRRPVPATVRSGRSPRHFAPRPTRPARGCAFARRGRRVRQESPGRAPAGGSTRARWPARRRRPASPARSRRLRGRRRTPSKRTAHGASARATRAVRRGRGGRVVASRPPGPRRADRQPRRGGVSPDTAGPAVPAVRGRAGERKGRRQRAWRSVPRRSTA